MFRIKLFSVITLGCLLAVLLLPGCGGGYTAGSFTDDLGRSVRFEKAPERIVSHVPSINETLYALGLEERLAGVSDYCDYPPEAKNKPSVGNYFNPSLEKIVSLEPDLVLTDGHSENVKGLEGLGVPFFTFDPKDIAGIMKDIELLGKLTGTEKKAAEVTAGMRADIAAVAEKVKNAPKPRVLYVIDLTNPALPWTAGPGSFIDTMINLAGGENVAKDAPGAWVELSLETIASADPEVILLPAQHGTAFTPAEDLKNNPVWGRMTAVKNGRVHTVDADPVESTGPRITEGLEQIAASIHPELFK